MRATQILSGITDGASACSDLPRRLVDACARALPVVAVRLVLTTHAGPPVTLAVTDGPAATMGELQRDLGEGPSVDASRTGRPVLQPELAGTGPDRWPGFTEGALATGIRAVFAFPLRSGAIRLGVLDLYRDRAGGLPDGRLAEALAFTDAATTVLLDRQAHRALGGVHGSIPRLVGRAEVHEATGMVSVQAEVSLADALVLLQARAFAAERPVIDVARDVLGRRVRFTADGDGHRS